MKIQLSFIVLLVLPFWSCEKNDVKTDYPVGQGLEIYLTMTPHSNTPDYDYNNYKLDTVELSETPVLRYNNLEKYDTITHKLSLNIPYDSLKFGPAGVYGRMFVVTVDKEPVYCGFKWSLNSSVPCYWVFIEDYLQENNQLNSNEMIINFVSPPLYTDPRLDKRIIDRLKRDGKIR